MRNVNLGGSWMDEFYKISEEKGWIKEAEITKSQLEMVWGSFSDAQKERFIPGWQTLSFSELLDEIKHKWGGLLTEYRKNLSTRERVQEKVEPKQIRTAPSSSLVGKLQSIIYRGTGLLLSDPKSKFLGGPDGSWGPMSAKAWNEYIKNYETGALNPVPEDGSRLPKKEDIRYVFSNPKLKGEKKDLPKGWNMPGMSEKEMKDLTSVNLPKTEDILEQMRTKQPGQQPEDVVLNRADDKVAYVVNELVALANDLDSLGEEKSAIAVDGQLKLYKEAMSKLYDITGETGEKLIEQAHPGGGPVLAPSKDEGGKVETIVEEQKKSIQKVMKQPTGKYAEKRAEVIGKLIATANRLEDEGEIKAAKLIDKTIKEILDTPPFVGRSTVAAGSKSITASIQEDVATDIADFIVHLKRTTTFYVGNEFKPIINKIVKDLEPHISIFKKIDEMDFTKENDRKIINNNIINLTRTLNEITPLFSRIVEDYRSSIWISDATKIVKPFYDIWKSISKLKAAVNFITNKESPQKKDYKIEKVKSRTDEMNEFQRNNVNKYLKQLQILKQLIESNKKKLHKVIKNPKNLSDWVIFKEYNILNPKTKRPYTPDGPAIEKLETLINKLNQGLNKVKSASIKTAGPGAAAPGAAAPRVTFIEKKQPGTTGGRTVNKDPAVEGLQKAIKDAGIFNFKDHGTDGKWGKETMEAWKTLRNKFPKANLSPPQKDYSSLKNEFSKAIRFIEYFDRKKKQTANENISFRFFDKDFMLNDFNDKQTFYLALKRTGLFDENLKTRLSEGITQEEFTENHVKNHAIKLYKALNGEDGKLIEVFHGPEFFNQLKIKIIKLVGTILKETETLPSKQVKTPGQETKKQKDPGPLNRGGNRLLQSKVQDIYDAIKVLPDPQEMKTVSRFKGKAEAVIPKERLQGRAPEEVYWNDLKARYLKIYQAVSVRKEEIMKYFNSKRTFQSMLDTIITFGDELNDIRKQLGF